MISITEAKNKVAHYFDRNQTHWAVALFERAITDNNEPLQVDYSLSLKPPTEKEVLRDTTQARAWARAWRKDPHASFIQWITREWSSVGRQEVPDRLVFTSPEDIAGFAHRKSQWNKSWKRCLALASRWNSRWRAQCLMPEQLYLCTTLDQNVAQVVGKTLLKSSSLSDKDWDMLLLVLDWLLDNPETRVYVRQLPIRGIDSKWLEQHRAVIEPLYSAMTEKPGFVFLKTPHQFRMKFLDAALAPDGICDLSLSPQELNRYPKLPKLVFILENLVSVLAFPAIDGALVIHGSGYAVSAFSDVTWLRQVPVLYWGDLDSNGFAILNQLRHHHPHVTSMMMDTKTLEQHRELCVYEERPNRGSFDHLTAEERETLDLLLSGDKALRLEQERIEWDYVLREVPMYLSSPTFNYMD
ncbi:MAG: DUF2220 family protein [Coriobacteriia bacterium]|nr:DUF2220 family protein [Coriobacteriia bacterium]